MATIKTTSSVQTARVEFREMVQILNAGLGATLVAAITGNKDLKVSHRWARMDGPMPRNDAVQRIVHAYQVWDLVASREGDHVARLWFMGMNPRLDDDTPIDALREGRPKEAMAAARAFVEDALS